MSNVIYSGSGPHAFSSQGGVIEGGHKAPPSKSNACAGLGQEHAAWIASETFHYPVGSEARKFPFAYTIIGLAVVCGMFWGVVAFALI